MNDENNTTEKLETKICEVCKEEKTLDKFHETASRDRKTKIIYEFCCLECFQRIQDEEKIKREKIEEYERTTTTKCKGCGETKTLAEMKNQKFCLICYGEDPENCKAQPLKEYVYVSEKKCCDCKEIKPIEEFSKNKTHKDGHAANCKDCAHEYNTIYRIANQEKLAAQKREKYANDEQRLEKGAEYREKNREKIRAWDRMYSNKFRSEKTARDSEYRRKRKKRDPLYKLYMNIKSRVRSYIVTYSKSKKKRNKSKEFIDMSVFDILGFCPAKGYQLDHIIPLRAFDPNDVEMLKLAHCLENLRWIPAFDNDSKNDKIIWSLLESSEKLLEICSILKITKEDDGKNANDIFPIVDGNFMRRI